MPATSAAALKRKKKRTGERVRERKKKNPEKVRAQKTRYLARKTWKVDPRSLQLARKTRKDDPRSLQLTVVLTDFGKVAERRAQKKPREV